MTAADPTATAPQPATLDLAPIEVRAHGYHLLTNQIDSGSLSLLSTADRSAADVPALVAEVRRLRAEQDSFRRERAILRWAADRLVADHGPAYAGAVADLRRWAAELDAAATARAHATTPAGTEAQ